MNEFVEVPERTLPCGLLVPSFKVGKYFTSRGEDGTAVITKEGTPWVRIKKEDARLAATSAGMKLMKDSQRLSLALNVVSQDDNWTGGKVGVGHVYMGLHKGTVRSAQPGTYDSKDPEERRWFVLSNGEVIWDAAGNIYTWLDDDIQGDEQGLITIIKKDSPSLTTSPYPSEEKGTGWRPKGDVDWPGDSLIGGGCWDSGTYAGVFYLDYYWPDFEKDDLGFRCTID